MQPKMSRFGFLTVNTRAERDDTLKGVLARSKRKSKANITLPPIGEKKDERPKKPKRNK